jgi:glycerophosphoryl diester phosphodiesterase
VRTPLVVPRATPLLLAHGGAVARATDHSRDAIRDAARLDLDGVELGVWRTRDGRLVIAREGRVRRGVRLRALADLDRNDLGPDVPLLSEVLETLGAGHHLVLHAPDIGVVHACLEAVASVPGLATRTWLCHADLATCAAWADVVRRAHEERSRAPRVVHVARLEGLAGGPERCTARLADAGIASLALPHDEWTGGLVALAHRFGLEAFARSVAFARQARAAALAGCDLVSGGDPAALHEARRVREGS